MGLIRWLDKYIEESILVSLSILTVSVVFVQVIMRYIFGNSLIWSEELARYAFIWLIYIGVSYAVKKKRHISVEALSIYMNKNGKYLLSLVAHLLFLLFAVVITYYSLQIFSSAKRLSPALNLSIKWVYAAPMVGMLLTSIRIIQAMIKDYKTFKSKEVGGPL